MIETNINDTQITLITGGITLVLSLVMMFYYYHAKGLLDEMWVVDTYDATELRRMCSGGFNATVEVEGQASCDIPLIAPASKFPCCWCRTRVDREVESVRYSRSGVRTEHIWHTDYDRTLTSIFKVNDKTGFTLVDPTDADIDTEAPYTLITTEREPWFGAEVGYSDTGRYRVREEIFVPSGYVYVLGQASNCQDGPDCDVLVHYPSEGYTDPNRRRFIISRKTEKDLMSANEISLKLCFWAGIMGFLFSAYCLLSALRLAP